MCTFRGLPSSFLRVQKPQPYQSWGTWSQEHCQFQPARLNLKQQLKNFTLCLNLLLHSYWSFAFHLLLCAILLNFWHQLFSFIREGDEVSTSLFTILLSIFRVGSRIPLCFLVWGTSCQYMKNKKFNQQWQQKIISSDFV